MKEPLPKNTLMMLDMLAAILIRCFLVTVFCLIFVWIMIGIFGDLFYQITTFWYEIPRADYELYLLYSLTFMKILNVILFFIPYIAIKIFQFGKQKEKL